MYSGKTRTLEIPISEDEYRKYLVSSQDIQTLLPQLSAGQREFIMTGITDEEWEEMNEGLDD